MGLWDDEEKPIEPSQRASPESRKAPPRRISFPFSPSPSHFSPTASKNARFLSHPLPPVKCVQGRELAARRRANGDRDSRGGSDLKFKSRWRCRLASRPSVVVVCSSKSSCIALYLYHRFLLLKGSRFTVRFADSLDSRYRNSFLSLPSSEFRRFAIRSRSGMLAASNEGREIWCRLRWAKGKSENVYRDV